MGRKEEATALIQTALKMPQPWNYMAMADSH